MKRLTLIILLMISIMSCTSKSRKPQPPEVVYGLAFNHERHEIGLTPLDDNWEVSFHDESDMIEWNPQNLDSLKSTSVAFYGAKIIRFNNDSLWFESDHFIIDGPVDGDSYKRLIYMYEFSSSDSSGIGWKYTLTTSKKGDWTVYTKHLTKHEADSILAAWDLKHP